MRDDWQKERDTDFDWRETPLFKHPDVNGEKCDCPRHEHLKEISIDSVNTLSAIRLKLCPDHYKAYYETLDETQSKIPWWQRLIFKLVIKIGLVKIIELRYAQSDLCMWCKFGSGGRGIKHMPTIDGS